MNEQTTLSADVPADPIKEGDKVAWLFGGHCFQGKVLDIGPVGSLAHHHFVAMQTDSGKGVREMRHWCYASKRWIGNCYRLPHEADRLLTDAKAILDDLRVTIRIAEQAIVSMEEQQD